MRKAKYVSVLADADVLRACQQLNIWETPKLPRCAYEAIKKLLLYAGVNHPGCTSPDKPMCPCERVPMALTTHWQRGITLAMAIESIERACFGC